MFQQRADLLLITESWIVRHQLLQVLIAVGTDEAFVVLGAASALLHWQEPHLSDQALLQIFVVNITRDTELVLDHVANAHGKGLSRLLRSTAMGHIVLALLVINVLVVHELWEHRIHKVDVHFVAMFSEQVVLDILGFLGAARHAYTQFN